MFPTDLGDGSPARRPHWLRRRRAAVNELDRAVSRTVSALPPSALDGLMKNLSRAADHSVLWFAVAAVLTARRGRTRKAGLRGVAAIAGASLAANAVCKPLLPRRRPAAGELPAYQTLPHPPTSSSFPSGHAASAVAFATAAAMESPRLGLALAPLAGAVAYSRVHTGVHWTSDVLAGGVLGAGVALATRRWWPVRDSDEAKARPSDTVPRLPHGAGLVLVVNARSGDPDHDPTDDVVTAFPAATVLRVRPDQRLDAVLDAAAERLGDTVRALGVAGGDGSVAAAAAVAVRRGLPLVVVPTGTLNHFARDVGVYDLQEAVDAAGAGEAVAVDVGLIEVHPGGEDDPESDRVLRTVSFLNTAALGSYPELVRIREHWQPRLGKWPAFALALVRVLHHAEVVRIRLDGEWVSVWFLFVGNGPYHPRGMWPAWRPSLYSGLLDVRWLRADVRFSRLRAVCALMLGALGHSHVYRHRETDVVDVELARPGRLATDGEVVAKTGRYRFRVAPDPVLVYRRDETRWTDRERPFLRR